jgi:hypothetical protein
LKQKILFGTLTILAILSGCMVAAALTTYTQTITWNYQTVNESFTVSNPTTVDYGTLLGATTKTETYTITNNGNVAITVNAAATPVGASALWDKTSAPIAVGASTTFTLTLHITGAGSCSVSFAKA